LDVLVAQGTPSALAARRATTTTPIVVFFVADAVETGLVASLARPGGNVTGLSFLGPEKVPKHLDAAFAAALRERAQALFVAPLITRADADRIVAFASTNRLPTIGSVSPSYVEAGMLLHYTPSIAEQYQRVASYVDRILRGARPADLPVEQPTRFELLVNLETARSLGLTVPAPLLLRADRVIE
jgi:putative ABC transport system substrate-binding protein